MVISIELPTDVEESLSAEAARNGLTLTEFATQLLTEATATARLGDGAALVEFWQREGLIGWRSDIADTGAYARQLREEATRRSGGA